MIKQLYRFRVQNESSPGVLIALDEADQSKVRLLSVDCPDNSEAAVKQMEEIANESQCESFTAQNKFFTVASSDQQLRDLRIAYIGKGYIQPDPPEEVPPVPEEDDRPGKSHAKIWLVCAALVLVATVMFIVQHRPSPATPRVIPAYVPPTDYYAEGKTYFEQRHFKEARESFEKACSEGSASGCSYLAYVCTEGLGGPSDLQKARQLYSKGCQNRRYGDCEGLGTVYQDEHNLGLAATYYAKACRGGVAEACQRWKALR